MDIDLVLGVGLSLIRLHLKEVDFNSNFFTIIFRSLKLYSVDNHLG